MTGDSGDDRVVVLSDPDALAEESAAVFARLADSAIRDHGAFRVALSGGSTPRAMYERLARSPHADEIDWPNVQVFFSDERFVPLTSDESNFHLAHEFLLSHVTIPERFVHPYATDDIPPEESAGLYEEGIRRVFQTPLDKTPEFDLILLGIGGDGHTASLFPETAALSVRDRLVTANYVPKMSSWRLTFTYPLINAANNVAFLVQGEDKAERVRQVMEGDGQLPAARVRPRGRLLWLLDRAAASRLSEEQVLTPENR